MDSIAISNVPIFELKPGASYWRGYIFIVPVAFGFATALSVLVLRAFISSEELRALVILPIASGLLIGGILVGLSMRRDTRKMYFALFVDRIVLGRGSNRLEIYFSEIQTISVGLPKGKAFFSMLARLHPAGRMVELIRSDCLAIRMTDRRFVALQLRLLYAENSSACVERFWELNESKFQANVTFTESEIREISCVRMNKLIRLADA